MVTKPYHTTSRSRLPKLMRKGQTTDSSSGSQGSSTENSESVSPWNDTNTQSLSAGWSRSSWFGDFFGNGQGWVYHFNHGWLYLEGVDESGFWVYDETLGWLYTGKDLYPFFYRDSSSSWLYDQSSPSEQVLGLCGQGVVTPSKKLADFLRFTLRWVCESNNLRF